MCGYPGPCRYHRLRLGHRRGSWDEGMQHRPARIDVLGFRTGGGLLSEIYPSLDGTAIVYFSRCEQTCLDRDDSLGRLTSHWPSCPGRLRRGPNRGRPPTAVFRLRRVGLDQVGIDRLAEHHADFIRQDVQDRFAVVIFEIFDLVEGC